MAFGLSSGDREESGGPTEGRGNRPDCAYFLLLGLCGAAFLLTIGGILTYIAFNPGSVDSRPHSPLSHIPHFHHHRKHHDRTEGHYFGHFEHHDELKHNNNVHHTAAAAQQQQQQHHIPHSSSDVHVPATTLPPSQPSQPPNVDSLGEKTTLSPQMMTTATTSVERKEDNETSSKPESTYSSGDNATNTITSTPPGSHLETPHLNKKEGNASTSSIVTSPSSHSPLDGSENGKDDGQHHFSFSSTPHRNYNNNKSNGTHHHPLLDTSSSSHHSNPHQQQQQHHPHPGLISSVTHHHENGTGYEYQAKQSLALAIIGPLCLLMGIIVTLIVGVFALRYDCDHEPEPNIAFLRLRSEMSLNFDPSKNNYELLMPASSSTTAGVGSTHSIHPGGMPRC